MNELDPPGDWPEENRQPDDRPSSPAGTGDSNMLFRRDARGRTPLFQTAAQGDYQAVCAMLFSLSGTGLYPQRLALIAIRDDAGLTAADVAEQNGHRAIAELLRGDQGRMEMFE